MSGDHLSAASARRPDDNPADQEPANATNAAWIRYMREGKWQIMIHGESYKPIVAE